MTFDVPIDKRVPRDGVSGVGVFVEQFPCVVDIAGAHMFVDLVVEIKSRDCVSMEV